MSTNTNLVITFLPLLTRGAGFTSYLATFRDGRGDMLRFLGWTLTQFLGDLGLAMDDVGMRAKTTILFNRLLTLFRRLDGQYGIIDKAQLIFAQVIKDK